MESRKDFFMSKEKIEEEIFNLNKDLENKILDKETLLSKIAILNYVIEKDKKKLINLRERLQNE